jgi:hypothetical protein
MSWQMRYLVSQIQRGSPRLFAPLFSITIMLPAVPIDPRELLAGFVLGTVANGWEGV